METLIKTTIPGRKSRMLSRRLMRVESRNVTFLSGDFPVFWERASGASVRDVDGRTYLDLTSAFAVTGLGHGAPAIRKALVAQSRKMWHGMGDVHPNAVKVELLERLAELAPGRLGVSILSSTGSEAVESALKTSRLYTGKPGVIAFRGGYHGLSYGTLGATDRRDFSAPFQDQLASHVARMPFPDTLRGPTDAEALQAIAKFLASGSKSPAGPIGAILFEVVQGRGGIRIASPTFLRGLCDLARQHRLLLIADEIMTGLGRTGRMFAVNHAGVVPDLLCIGKAVANGFPLSACVGTPEVMEAWPASDGEAIHTSTFLGNPLGCAMGVASLRLIKSRNLAGRAATLGQWWLDLLRKELSGHPRVGDVRGLGLMVGIECVKDKKSMDPDPQWASRVVVESLQRGLLILSGGNSRNVITLTPPLTITQDQLKKATGLLKEAFYGSSRN